MKVALIGLGEAGSALITGWGLGAQDVSAFDRQTDDPATAPEMHTRYAALRVTGRARLDEALAGAEIVLSVVTADQAEAVAQAAAPHLEAGAYFCDLNSCAPAAKQRSAQAVEAAGSRYVDVAVMAPVHPALNAVPCLLSGPHAEAVLPLLGQLLTNLKVVPGPVGRASTIKMVRSVLVKGLEALTAEFMLAVAAADVADEVLPTLQINYPGWDWDAQATYNFERAMVHGVRRAAEMEEVVKTLADLGLPSTVTEATLGWERKLAAVPVPAPDDPARTDAMTLAQSLLPHVKART